MRAGASGGKRADSTDMGFTKQGLCPRKTHRLLANPALMEARRRGGDMRGKGLKLSLNASLFHIRVIPQPSLEENIPVLNTAPPPDKSWPLHLSSPSLSTLLIPCPTHLCSLSVHTVIPTLGRLVLYPEETGKIQTGSSRSSEDDEQANRR